MVRTRSSDAGGGGSAGGGGGASAPSSSSAAASSSSSRRGAAATTRGGGGAGAGAGANGGREALAKLEGYMEKVKQLERENNKLRKDLAKAEKQQYGGGGGGASSASDGKLRQENARLEAKVQVLKKEVEDMKAACQRKIEEAKAAFKNQGKLYGDQRAAEAEKKAADRNTWLKDHADKLKDENTRLKRELKEANEAKAKAERGGGGGAGDASDQLRELQEENARLRRELKEAKALEGQLGTLQQDFEVMQQELDRAVRGREHAEKAKRDLEAVLESRPAAASPTKSPATRELEDRVTRLRQQLAELESAKEEAERQAGQARQRAEDEQADHQRLKMQFAEMKRGQNNLAANVRDLQAQKKELQERLEEMTRARNALDDELRRLRNRQPSPARANSSSRDQEREREREVEIARLLEHQEALQSAKAEIEEAHARDKRAIGKMEEELRTLRTQAQQLQEQQQAQQQAARPASVASSVGGGRRSSIGLPLLLPPGATRDTELERYREQYERMRDIVQGQDAAVSLLYIQEVNATSGYLVLHNASPFDISVAGWRLRATNTDAAFELPESLMMPARGRLRVWWGSENRQYRTNPPRDNTFWEESESFEIFRGDDEVVELVDPEDEPMSRMKVVAGKRRLRSGPGAGSPTPGKKPRMSTSSPAAAGAGGGARTPRL